MLITLKQKEIQAALRLYVSQNGIDLTGKNVDITFTAGRKESGLSAEVSIEDDGSMALNPVETPVQVPQAVVATITAEAPVAETVVATVEAANDAATEAVAAPSGSIFG